MMRFRFQCDFENPKLKANRFDSRSSVLKPQLFQNRKTELFGAGGGGGEKAIPFSSVRFDSCFDFSFRFQVPIPTHRSSLQNSIQFKIICLF